MTTVREIQCVVAEHFSLPRSVMQSPSRFRSYARPRQVAMFFARRLADKSANNVGRMFGGRDHSTVLYAEKQVVKLCNEDEAFRRDVDALAERLLAA